MRRLLAWTLAAIGIAVPPHAQAQENAVIGLVRLSDRENVPPGLVRVSVLNTSIFDKDVNEDGVYGLRVSTAFESIELLYEAANYWPQHSGILENKQPINRRKKVELKKKNPPSDIMNLDYLAERVKVMAIIAKRAKDAKQRDSLERDLIKYVKEIPKDAKQAAAAISVIQKNWGKKLSLDFKDRNKSPNHPSFEGTFLRGRIRLTAVVKRNP